MRVDMKLTLYPSWRDGAVVQRDVDLRLRGTAAPGDSIHGVFANREFMAAADSAGEWTASLGCHGAGGPYDLRVADDHGTQVILRNLLVGEVWICSGQSNMEMPLSRASGGAADAARAADDGLRLMIVPPRVADEPAKSCEARWQASGPESAAPFSAMGYYFGRHLREALGVPIGLIQAAVGNTPGEAWTPRPDLDADADFTPIFERWRRSLAVYPDAAGTYAAAFAEWDGATDLAEREGRPIPGAHPKLVGPGHPWTPAGLFNGMIAPVTGFPIRGVVWYQGAGAPERATQYRKLFRVLIRAWRRWWGQGDFPFLFGQEANFGPRRDLPCEHSWAELREAQAMALAEPNTGMAVAIDVGDATDIHPVRKKPLGDRLALIARHKVYGHAVAWSGPTLRAVRIDGDRVRLAFDHCEGGLTTSDGDAPRGFAVSGGAQSFAAGNRGFTWAEAEISGDEVVAWSGDVAHPIAVRYAWAQNPACNLVNGAGLPASPFRTDDWPGVTESNL